MERTDTIVIGAGQAGLAASRCLTDLGIDHVVLERGRVAERWRTERWDSLRMLTPRWQSRLPGWRYQGPDPDGFMSMPELIGYLGDYARSFAAPVREGVAVAAVLPDGDGYRVETDRGTWRAPAVIVATGHCDVPATPEFAAALSPALHQVVPTRYRNPSQLPPGGVLVVGAAASGVQLAAELRRAGREVTLAVGRHTRLPRRHLGRDILWWLDAMGVLARPTASLRDLEAVRQEPSWQLVGAADGRDVDLPALRAAGVRLVGRAVGAAGGTIELADDLEERAADADARAARVLARIDGFAAAHRLALGPPATLPSIAPAASPSRLDLGAEGISTVVWATGFTRHYGWLRVPGVVAGAELRHQDGVTTAPGLYALGLRLQRRRNSSFLDGVGDDARFITHHLARHLGHDRAAA